MKVGAKNEVAGCFEYSFADSPTEEELVTLCLNNKEGSGGHVMLQAIYSNRK